MTDKGQTAAPPHDPTAENAALGAILNHPHTAAAVLHICKASDFYIKTQLADTIETLHHKGVAPEPVAVQMALTADGATTVLADLLQLAYQAPSDNGALHAAQAVAETARKRQLLHVAHELAHHATNGTTAAQAAAQATQALDQIEHTTNPQLVTYINWPDLWDDTTTTCDWLVEPLIPTGRQVAIFSPAKTGKSLLALEIAAAVATGRPVLDQPAQTPLNVIYIDLEMVKDDLRSRLEDLGYGPQDNLQHLHYCQLAALPPMDTPDGGNLIGALIADTQAQLVVIDTMARAVAGDENEADTYRRFFRHTGRIIKASGAALLRLDHAGKDVLKGQRGSSSKDDDVDIVFRMNSDGKRVRMVCTRKRVPYVSDEIELIRHEEPNLKHTTTTTDTTWPTGTADTAADLDTLKVPLDATVTTAARTLRAAGLGKRTLVVAKALTWRRTR